jgi:hypothetical protein
MNLHTYSAKSLREDLRADLPPTANAFPASNACQVACARAKITGVELVFSPRLFDTPQTASHYLQPDAWRIGIDRHAFQLPPPRPRLANSSRYNHVQQKAGLGTVTRVRDFHEDAHLEIIQTGLELTTLL